jgi:hypothetical protein
MATLNSSNITDGNTIEPTDILQLYDAFTSGGGTTGAYNVTVSGSLIGNASTSTSSSYAISASRAVSSSYAVTASYAANASATVTQINSQGYSNIGAGPVEATFKFYAGKVRMVTNSGTTADFPGLAGKTLGTNVWVTATIQGQASSFTAPNLVTVRSLSANGAITIETASVPDTTEVHFHVIYVP